AAAALESASVTDPVVEASIRTTLGETYLGLGEPAKAIHQFDRALTLRRENLDRNDRATLRSMDSLADAYMARGQVDRARPLYDEALSRGKAALGDQDLDVLAFMNGLGRAYLPSDAALAEPVLPRARAGL